MTESKQNPVAWPHVPSPHVQELSEGRDRVVSFVTVDGVERAVWDNGCYHEMFRYAPEDRRWNAETIETMEQLPADALDIYGQACLHLDDIAIRARALPGELEVGSWKDGAS